jgi:AraC-like DNA-binding protein
LGQEPEVARGSRAPSEAEGLTSRRRVRKEWLLLINDAAQAAIGRTALGHDPRRMCRRLLHDRLEPASPLEELLYHGVILNVALGGFGRSRTDRRQKIERVLRRLLPSVSRAAPRDALVVRRAIAVIVRDFAKPLDVGAVADEVRCAEPTLRRLFKARTQISMRAFHIRVRVREAIRLFDEGVSNILAVARLVGYESEKNLYRAFQSVVGMTPAKVRALPRGTVFVSLPIAD